MTFYIKIMVCARCIRTVERLVTEASLEVKNVQLDEARLATSPNPAQILMNDEFLCHPFIIS